MKDYTKANVEEAVAELLEATGMSKPAIRAVQEHTTLPQFVRTACELAYVADIHPGSYLTAQRLVRKAASALANEGQFNFLEPR